MTSRYNQFRLQANDIRNVLRDVISRYNGTPLEYRGNEPWAREETVRKTGDS